MNHNSRGRRGNPWALACVGLALVSALVLSACNRGPSQAGADGEQGDHTVAFISHAGPGDSFWSTVENGVRAAGEDLGVTVTYEGSAGDPQKQAQLVNAAIDRNVSAIVVSLPNPGALAPPIKRALAADVPVFSVNSGLSSYEEVGSLAHVSEDEIIAGRAVGERFSEEGMNNVLCVVQEQGNVGLESYCKGVAETFKGKAENLYVAGLGDVPGSRATIQSALVADRSIDGVFSLTPDLATAADQAIAGANSKAKLAVWNLSNDVLKLIASGKILFAEDQQPYLQGYQPIATAYLYLTAGVLPGGPILTGPTFVDETNVQKVEELKEQGVR